jgi:hypothetical protein
MTGDTSGTVGFSRGCHPAPMPSRPGVGTARLLGGRPGGGSRQSGPQPTANPAAGSEVGGHFALAFPAVSCRLSAQFVGSAAEESRATCSQRCAVPLRPILSPLAEPTGRTRLARFSALPEEQFPLATGWFDRGKPELGGPPGWGRYRSVSATCRTGNRPVKVPVGNSPNSPRGATAPLPAKKSRVDSGTRSRPVRSIPLAGATLHHGGSRLPPPASR